MIADNIQCIYVDKGITLRSSHHAGEQCSTSDGTSRPNKVIPALFRAFPTVHLCSSIFDILDILDSQSNAHTCVLVHIDQGALQSLTETSSQQVVYNRATSLHEMDKLTREDVQRLSGVGILRYLHLVLTTPRLNGVSTAALLDTRCTGDVYQQLRDICTLALIDNLEDDDSLQRLGREVLHSARSTSQPNSSDLDFEKYENQDVQPTQLEWESLRGRIHHITHAHIPSRCGILDHHMPKFEPGMIRESGYYRSKIFLSKMPMLRQLVSTWEFSTLQLSESDLVDCAVIIFKHVFSIPGTEEWHLSDEELFSFIDTIRRSYYATNPYHNFRHAVDVLQAVFYMMLCGNAMPLIVPGTAKFPDVDDPVFNTLFTPQHIIGSCIVGIGHDVGHPGVNNAFLVTTKAPLAMLYSDRSVLENFHCATLSQTLSSKWPATQQGPMRKIIIDLILSTDMGLHFDYMTRFTEIENACIAGRAMRANNIVVPEIPQATIESYRIALFSALIKCADISNVARPFAISREWSHVLLREFFNQGRLELNLGLPVTKNLDARTTVQAGSQVFFIEFFARPLFASIGMVHTNLQPIRDTLEANCKLWKHGGVPAKDHSDAGKSDVRQAASSLGSIATNEDGSISSEPGYITYSKPMSSDGPSRSDSEAQMVSCLPAIFRKKKHEIGA